MNNFYIYFHINTIKNEVFYVGKGYRDRAHTKHNRNSFWYNVVNKYGEPKIVIVKENISESYAFLLEKAYIKIFGRRDLGLGTLVNLTDGGDGKSGYIFSKESKNKTSVANKGKKRAKKSKIKMSLAKKGKKLSKEHKENISNSSKGNKMSKESKMKLSLAKKGKITVKDKEGNIFQVNKNDSRFLSGELVGHTKKVKAIFNKKTGKKEWISYKK